jgi:5'-nucleotidase
MTDDITRILVTNDDGYTADGITALLDALDGLAEVWMVAPDREQSAMSHALTLDRPLRAREVSPRRFAVNGTPTDCVALALSCLMRDARPSVVVSGINRGANMGVDVHYSGTVSAAFEGVISGVPAIAVSKVVTNGIDWTSAAAVARELTSWVLRNGLPPNTLLNVNVPGDEPLGLKLTRLGVRRYTEGMVEQTDPRGRPIYWLGSGEPVWERIPGTDFNEVGEGFVSVTPLHLDMTATDVLGSLLVTPPTWVRDYSGA